MENALEIVDDTEEKSQRLENDIMDTFSCKFDNLNLSDNLNPSETTPNKKILKGIGDQLANRSGDIDMETFTPPMVEKKNRLSDLVKNSKQILSKLLSAESNLETNIKDTRVSENIDLDGESKVRRKKHRQTVNQEFGPLPPRDAPVSRRDNHTNTDNTERDRDDGKLEDVDLANADEIRAKTRTFPLAGPSAPSSSLLARYRTLKFSNDLKHKKWNFGSKIINYIKKKGHGRKSDGNESKASEGIEITPKEDN